MVYESELGQKNPVSIGISTVSVYPQDSHSKLNAVKTVYEITGQYDISVIIRAPSITEINAAIDELRKIQGVIDTNTVIILRTIR